DYYCQVWGSTSGHMF
nr:immunoglobulin light chain junction region [Macaca mulatta]